MKRLIQSAVMALCFSFLPLANASEAECIGSILQSAKAKMQADAQKLYGTSTVVNWNQFSQKSKRNFEVTATVIALDGLPTLAGARFVDDKINVQLVSETCEMTIVTRLKSEVFVGCYGGCPENLTYDRDALTELYR